MAVRWRLGPWLIDPARNRIWQHDGSAEQQLEPRLMQVLQRLLQAGEQPLVDAELLQTVWAGQVVSDASIYQAIARLRKALGDSHKPYRFIERISGKGYRLLQPALPLSPPVGRKQRLAGHRLPLLAAVGGLIAVTVWWWKIDPPPRSVSPATVAEPVVSDAESAREHYLLGRWLWRQGSTVELDQAVSEFKRAIALDPGLAIARVGLCDAYHFQHVYGERPLQQVLAWCEPLLRDALELQPKLGEALASFALLRLTQGDLDAAEHYLDLALQQAPKHAMAWAWSAQLQRRRGRPAQALEHMQQAAQLDPLSGLMKRHLAYALAANGRLAESRAVYREALLLEPDYTDRPIDEIDMLPLTVERAIRFIEWTRRYPDRIAAQPDGDEGIGASVNLALVWLSLGDTERADSALRVAERQRADHHYVLFARAAWWRASGNVEQALMLAEQRAAQQPGNPSFRGPVWVLQRELGQTAAVRDSLTALVPASTDAATALSKRLPLLAIWLSVATEQERRRLQPAVKALLAAAPPEIEFPELTLRVLIGDEAAASEDLRQSLNDGWLPFAGNGFYLPEQDPIWRSLDADLLRLLNANRRRVLVAVGA
ncbi:MAG TPA: winged helix-turn-helix domain-containing protein [Arenimonas sp.]|nr:winged helix-turn-helix domain-containing protein [Arenimonas sp.]